MTHSLRSGSPISPSSHVSRSPAGLGPAAPQPSSWRIWILAARLPTLPAAVVPVLVGSAAAFGQGAFSATVLAAALVASILIQIGTNFANDLFDFRKGADTDQRVGPLRATQAGLLSEGQMATGMWLTFALAFVTGLYLVAIGGWPILLIGVTGIAAGVLYTAGPWPLGYRGLGDVFVFVFFGLIAVSATYYLHTGVLTNFAVALSLPVGLLVTAILVVNNLRDVETDRVAGKRTLAVRLGTRATQGQFALFLAGAYAVPTILWLQGTGGHLLWLPWLTLPLGIKLVMIIFTQTGAALNQALKLTGILHLLFGLLLSLALMV